MKHFLHIGLWGLFSAITIVAVILVWRGFEARSLPELKLWHRIVLKSEFQAKQARPDMTFEEYRALEQTVFEELDRQIYQQVPPEEHLPYNRYDAESYSHPERFPQNWNRSFELLPDAVSGGVLMLHGLTDSPYSMHAVSRIFYERGFYRRVQHCMRPCNACQRQYTIKKPAGRERPAGPLWHDVEPVLLQALTAPCHQPQHTGRQ